MTLWCIAGDPVVPAEAGVYIQRSCRCGGVLQVTQELQEKQARHQHKQVSVSTGYDVWWCIAGDPVVPAEAGVYIHRS